MLAGKRKTSHAYAVIAVSLRFHSATNEYLMFMDYSEKMQSNKDLVFPFIK